MSKGHQLRHKETQKLRKQLIEPLVQQLIIDITLSSTRQKFLPIIEELQFKSACISCPPKIKWTFEDAMTSSNIYDKNMELYLCPTCGYLHFGHPNKKLNLAKQLILDSIN